MKNNYYLLSSFVFLILIIPNLILAQRMDTPGNQWSYNGTGFNGPYSFSIRMGTDTLINGMEYHKVLRSDTGQAPWIFDNGYLRQDDTEKVYYKYDNQEEELMFDFSLEVGDSLIYNDVLDPCYIVVEAIDSIILNDGIMRKRLEVSMTGGGDFFTDYLVIGMGSSNYGSFPYSSGCISDGSNDLACFYENNEVTFPEFSGICQLVNTEEAVISKSIRIYPNPVSEILTIMDDDQQLAYFELYDLMGKLLKADSLNPGDQTINVQALQPGIYLLSLTTKTGEKTTRKILRSN